MSDEIKDWQRAELLNLIRLIVPDAEFSDEESYSGRSIDFQDSCRCYSEYTTESCYLYVTVAGTLKGEGYEQAREIEHAVRKWADGALDWTGCDCCGRDLSVMCNLFALNSSRPAPQKETR